MRKKMVEYPDDACIVARPPWWTIHYSPSERKIYLDSSDYDSGPLALTREDLVWMIGVIDNWSEENKERILAWLEKNCKDYWLLPFELAMARAGTRKGFEIKEIRIGDKVLPVEEPEEDGDKRLNGI